MDKDFLYGNESIFLNDSALDFNFIPQVLIHRENQQAYIGNSIKLLEQNRNGRNLFIFGNPGIGKTLATIYVLKQVEENSLTWGKLAFGLIFGMLGILISLKFFKWIGW